jgi:hypothetical protein
MKTFMLMRFATTEVNADETTRGTQMPIQLG